MYGHLDRFEVTVIPRYLMKVTWVIAELATVIWRCVGWSLLESIMSLVFDDKDSLNSSNRYWEMDDE